MSAPAVEQWDAGYPRVSTDLQVERDALQTQVQALEAHAAAHGLCLRLYPDAGVSAKDTDRPRLQELIADVEAGRVRSVIVTKLDRISRSLADLLELMRLFEAHGVKFVSLRDSIDTSGPVGRFMLHILGAIAELERAITAERVAEDMKLRARRGKWNGGLAPYGRRVVDGWLATVPEEAVVLRRMLALLREKRSWRGVTVALNREGVRTRGWAPMERDGRVVRKGKPPSEWAPQSVRRVLLQPTNAGTLAYNRRRARGRTHVARPASEHVLVEGYCEPIFSAEEADELRRIAAEIEGTPPARTGSQHLLSGLVFCRCGARMYPARNYVDTRRGRRPVVYYRCRRATHAGTCATRQVPSAVLEPLVAHELRSLGLDPVRLRALAAAAAGRFAADAGLLFERRAALAREAERLTNRDETLLELVEDRLIDKEEFARRRGRLAEERAAAAAELRALEAELRARTDTAVDLAGTLSGLARMSDVYDELDEVGDRRRLLETCLGRLVVGDGVVEVHLPASSAIVVRLEPDEGGGPPSAT